MEQPSVKFVCVEGQEAQDEDSPSYYNAPEAIKVAEEVRQTEGQTDRQLSVCWCSGSAIDGWWAERTGYLCAGLLY